MAAMRNSARRFGRINGSVAGSVGSARVRDGARPADCPETLALPSRVLGPDPAPRERIRLFFIDLAASGAYLCPVKEWKRWPRETGAERAT